MTTAFFPSAPKSIGYDRETRDYMASYDGNVIGFFPNYSAAEEALNDYVLGLCEQALLDQPLATLAEQALRAANPTCIPDADWGAYATDDIAACACGLPAVVLLHGVHDTLDIALCYRCHGAYCSMDWPDTIQASAVPDDQPADDFSDVGPERSTRCVSLNDSPADPSYDDGCAPIAAVAVATCALVLCALLRN